MVQECYHEPVAESQSCGEPQTLASAKLVDGYRNSI